MVERTPAEADPSASSSEAEGEPDRKKETTGDEGDSAKSGSSASKLQKARLF
jgi:hypothetical protein